MQSCVSILYCRLALGECCATFIASTFASALLSVVNSYFHFCGNWLLLLLSEFYLALSLIVANWSRKPKWWQVESSQLVVVVVISRLIWLEKAIFSSHVVGPLEAKLSLACHVNTRCQFNGILCQHWKHNAKRRFKHIQSEKHIAMPMAMAKLTPFQQ